MRHTQRLAEAGAVASVGSTGDSYDNALAEAFNSLFKAELVRNKGPWCSIDDLEITVAEYVDWFNHRRLHGEIGLVPPVEHEDNYYRHNRAATPSMRHFRASTEPDTGQVPADRRPGGRRGRRLGEAARRRLRHRPADGVLPDNRAVARWVTPQPTDLRPQFQPKTFVREGGTLYSLSKEGLGTGGLLVTALTVAVVEAAEELAARSSVAGSPSRSSGSSTRRRTCAGGVSCQACTASTAAAASC